MKRRIVCFNVVLLLIIALLCCPALAQTPHNSDDVYYDMIKSNLGCDCALYDVDKDGSNELLILNDRGADCTVYKYNPASNEVVNCGDLWWSSKTDLGLYEHNDGLALFDSGSGYLHMEYVYLYTIENYELTYTVPISNEFSETEEVRAYVKKLTPISYTPTIEMLQSWTINTTNAQNEKVKIGDYIKAGTYLGEPMLWRCIYISDDGPVMFNNNIICYKNYDPCGWYITDNHGKNNEWAQSKLCSWLNSDEAAGNVQWRCNRNYEGVITGKLYDNEAGFLTNFSETELQAINPSENDRMFLLSVAQYGEMKKNANILGNDFILGSATTPAYNGLFDSKVLMFGDWWLVDEIDEEEPFNCITYDALREGPIPGYYWLRDLIGEAGRGLGVAAIDDRGQIVNAIESSCSNFGVRPAFCLNDNVYFSEGSGTEQDPYVIGEKNNTESENGLTFADTGDSSVKDGGAPSGVAPKKREKPLITKILSSRITYLIIALSFASVSALLFIKYFRNKNK